MMLFVFVFLVISLFLINVLGAAKAEFVIPFPGQVIPFGISGTFVTVVISCEGFTPQYAELTAKKNGVLIGGATIYSPNAGNRTLTTTLTFGRNISGLIEFSANIKDAGSSTIIPAKVTAIISTSSRPREKPTWIPCAIPQAQFVFPTAGQIVPLGKSNTKLTVVISFSGFTPDQGSYVVLQRGIVIASFEGMQLLEGPPPVFQAYAAFGVDVSGEIEFLATLKDSVSGESATTLIAFTIKSIDPLPAYYPYSYKCE